MCVKIKNFDVTVAIDNEALIHKLINKLGNYNLRYMIIKGNLMPENRFAREKCEITTHLTSY